MYYELQVHLLLALVLRNGSLVESLPYESIFFKQKSLNQVKLDLNLMESRRICDSGRVSEAVIGQTSTTSLVG